ncbi:toprim domain-containing protein [Halomonas vilamensis]|uniref:Toprim domain-containing protein n=1 Tax=Vreelandella vilamensis TaxID=531309 RepID=A0ABU1H9P9_9GAMM|nr:toprim domain-containing protein [Halomonas vilamensis]MDR5900437.1 toprim domain-containing protein [Halomonas vilamensis]
MAAITAKETRRGERRANSQYESERLNCTTIEQALGDALAAHGTTGLAIRADGDIHRFDSADKPGGNRNGWYVCPSLEVAVFGFWHTGEQHTVTTGGKSDPAAAAEARLAYQRAREQREAERRAQQAKTAEQARRWWATAGAADPSHPYLVTKRLAPYGLRQRDTMLLVPLFYDGELVNLERIYPDGAKKALFGGRAKGVAGLIGHLANAERVLIAEGWATAAALHEAMGVPVVVARNADNLEPVSRRLRQRLPDNVAITLAADDDRFTEGNPGITKARLAALTIGAKVLMPTFCADCSRCTDFADVALCRKERGL